MPLLGGLLVTIFTQFAAFFGLYFARKIAVALAGVAATGVLFAAIILCLKQTVLALLAAVSVSGPFAIGLGMVFPIHSALCLASIATTWACSVLFRWQKAGVDTWGRSA